MADLIDRDALLRSLDTQTGPDTVFQPVVVYGINVAKNIVKNMPAVDAEPVRHGRWDVSLDGITPFCTECSMSHRLMTRIPKYCPNCGAKMDEKEETDDT